MFYDIGMSAEGREEVSSWKGVEVRDVPKYIEVQGQVISTPDEVFDGSRYAFKPVVVFDALKREEAAGASVLWLDAGVELRRPFDGIRKVMSAKGHFLIEHEFR